MTSPDDDNARIKSAASVLLKGGTLVSEPCPRCGGVQVRVADKTKCVNCGFGIAPIEDQKTEAPSVRTSNLGASEAIVENKIAELSFVLKDEKDMAVQRQKAELLETYLRILEKIRALSAK